MLQMQMLPVLEIETPIVGGEYQVEKVLERIHLEAMIVLVYPKIRMLMRFYLSTTV